MRGFKRITAILLVFIITMGFFPAGVFAASSVEVKVEGYNAGKLKIRWENISGADEIKLSYKEPDGLGGVLPKEISLSPGTTSYEIEKLQDDYIYEVRVTLLRGGITIGEGLLYFLPGITFESSIIYENIVDTDDGATSEPPYDSKGGREIGTKPRLNVKWAAPRVFVQDASSGDRYVSANEGAALNYINSSIEKIYGASRKIDSLNYKINISQNKSDMTGNAAVLVNQDTSGYKAVLSGNTQDSGVKVRLNDSTGNMDFDLLGRKDANTNLPAAEEYGLPHPDVLPGTVYFMNIQMMIGGYQDAVVMGADGTSPLKGKPYTYTPIRFQLSKDDVGNIYAKVYTLNQGSLSLPDLYYEVQSNTVDSTYGWITRAKIDPDYFKDSYGRNQEFGIIPIVGASTVNKVYYRVITSSASDDVIKSQTLPYVMALDKSKPPIPKNINIKDRTVAVREAGGKRQVSTDVTVSWDKPLNWDEIKSNADEKNDLYYCFVLNINQTEITQRPYPSLIDEVNGIKYEDYFPAKYRLVKYVNARSVKQPDSVNDKIRENGNRLEYTLKGFDMFSFTDSEGVKQEFSEALRIKMGIETDYPDFLLSNRVYYMQMFTVKGNPETEDVFDSSSDRSVTASFTTLSGREKDVPLPDNFKLAQPDGNTYVVEEEVKDGVTHKVTKNIIKLQFDDIKGLRWSDYTTNKFSNKIYYDLYMSTSPDKGYVMIGSTDNAHDEYSSKNNVKFEVISEGQDKYIQAVVKDFEKEPALTSFGSKLTPNTIYYFKIKARLAMAKTAPDPADPSSPQYPDDYDLRESAFSFILPVTTVRGDMTDPDPGEKMPLAPTDFKIALDEKSNELLTGSSVVFDWERKESGVEYTLIATSERLPMNADPSMYINDPVYQDFKKHFGIAGEKAGIVLDPGLSEEQYLRNFKYDSATRACAYKVDEWLFPNRLYYFSLRAVNKNNGNLSSWVCIPVTTKLVDAPSGLEALKRGELGFYWTDPSINAKPEDFNVYIKGPKDKDFKAVTRSQCTVVRDSSTVIRNGVRNYIYYARIYNLDLNTGYDIRVYKGDGKSSPVYQKTNIYTRDGHHELEVKWKGRKGYKYEIAIKAADEVDYVTLTPEDLELYTDIEGKRNPYYFEETAQTYNNDDVYHFAKIKSLLVTLPDGLRERRALESNKKYHIKVRAVRVDAEDSTLTAYSKYIGPVEGRTEFDQDDYDKDKDGEDSKNKFLDRIKQIENRYFWRINISDSSANSVLLRGEKIINAMNSSMQKFFTVDISDFVLNIDTDVVYVPLDIIKTLNKDGKSLVIKTMEAEFTIRPDTFDIEDNDKIKALSGKPGVSDILVKLTVQRKGEGRIKLPNKAKPVSSIIDFDVEALGISRTTEALEEDIHNKLYDEDKGLVSEKLNILLNTYTGDIKKDSKIINRYADELVKLLELELSSYIHITLESMKLFWMRTNIETFDTPIMVRLYYNNSRGLKLPYVLYEGRSTWQKVTADTAASSNTLLFNATGAGQYAVLIVVNAAGDIPEDHWAIRDIQKFVSKYDLSGVFTGIENAFAPEDIVTCKEMVLLYETVMDAGNNSAGMDITQKLKKTELDSIFNARNTMGSLTKQQAAAVLVKIYSVKSGVDPQSLKLNSTLYIADEGLIDSRFFKSVMIVADKKFIQLDGNGYFYPGASMNRAQVISALVRLLENTGDI